MFDIRYPRDDLISMLQDAGIANVLKTWLKKNPSQEFVLELIQLEFGINLVPSQLRQLVSDLRFKGDLEGATGDDLPIPIIRPTAPSGIGIGNGNVWANEPGNGSYIFRFYVNGTHKITMTDYYIIDLVTIGATPGDIVQIGMVAPDDVLVDGKVVTVKGTVGWWAKIRVSS